VRVNMDSSIATDSRFKLVAHRLGVNLREVVGACYFLWLDCYERRSDRLRRIEVEVSAGITGFTDALLAEELATQLDGDLILIHGVKQRIEFLGAQSKKGSKGGKARAKKAKEQAQANAQANACDVAQAEPEAKATGVAQAYTLTLTQAQAQTLAPSPDQTLAPSPPLTPPGGTTRRGGKSKSVGLDRYRESAEDIVVRFNRILERNCDPGTWWPTVAKVLDRGFTPLECRAAIYLASTWSPEIQKSISPKTLFKLQSPQGHGTFAEYLDKARELWDEEHPSEPRPWEVNDAAH
jgi:hypothetical protein